MIETNSLLNKVLSKKLCMFAPIVHATLPIRTASQGVSFFLPNHPSNNCPEKTNHSSNLPHGPATPSHQKRLSAFFSFAMTCFYVTVMANGASATVRHPAHPTTSMLSAQCSALSAQCSALSAHRSVLTAQCSVLSAQCSSLSAQCSLLSFS